MNITNLVEKSSQKFKNQTTKANMVAANIPKRQFYFKKIYMSILDQVKDRLKKDYYYFLFMIAHCVNKNNKIDFDKFKKESELSESKIEKLRSKFKKAVLIEKIKTLSGLGYYLNPIISETGVPNNDELFDVFKEKTQKLYNIYTDY